MPPVLLQRRVDALIERCYAGLDAAALRREVVSRLKALAGVDAAFVATVDPATLLFTSAISEEPLIEAAPAFLENELRGVTSTGSPTSRPDLTRSGRWIRPPVVPGQHARHAAIMRPLGLGDELRVALRTRQACWGVMCLHRQAGATGFSPHDRDIVTKIAPHVAEGLRRALLAGRAADPHPALGHGVVILDVSGSVTSVNDAAERWLAQIPESDWPSSCQLPLPLLAAAAAAGHAGAASEQSPPAVRLRTVRGDWLSVHASPLHGGGEQSTVSILEDPAPGESVPAPGQPRCDRCPSPRGRARAARVLHQADRQSVGH